MQQPRDPLDQLLFVLIDVTVGVTDTPQHFHDTQLLVLRQLGIEPVREFVQGNCVVGTAARFGQKLLDCVGAEAEALLQQLADRIELR